MLNKCLDLVVAVPVGPVAEADVDRVAHLRVALGAGPKVDLADRLVLPIALHLHQLRVEANNKRVGEHNLCFNPTEEWFSPAELEPTETGNAGVSSARLPHFSGLFGSIRLIRRLNRRL